jgi:hypothetical protein
MRAEKLWEGYVVSFKKIFKDCKTGGERGNGARGWVIASYSIGVSGASVATEGAN